MTATVSRRRSTGLTPIRLGLIVTVIGVAFGVALFAKAEIFTALTPGDTIVANFAQQYRLKPFTTPVKIAGVPVGKVVGVDRAGDGSALVSLKLDTGTVQKLGSVPSAVIRPTTLLGGNYYVELTPGGDQSRMQGIIPMDRTSVPVELDKVVAALQPDALKGLQDSTGNLDGALADGGSAALKDLARTGPDTLGPAAGVLQSARGTHPETDLTQLVQGLESASHALAQQNGRLDSVITGLDSLSGVLDRRGADIASTLGDLPATLQATDAGMRSLDGTLEQLRRTAGPATPVVEHLDDLLGRTDPVLAKARPVVEDLRGLLVDARPLVNDLIPASQGLTTALDNLHGPVLDRVNGPILGTVNSPFHGTGSYAGGGGNDPLYQELGHMVANLDNATAMTDDNGATIAFNPGVNGGSIAGLPGVSIEQLFANLAKYKEIGR